ncbi:MAG: hypothetical protein ACTSVI_03110 [Promethearchaeota archaeon]
MINYDYVCPFIQVAANKSIKEKFDFSFDLTSVIIKLFFETKGKIEKKLGDLINIAVAYWPFYMVPIDANRAYVVEGKNLYNDKIATKVVVSKMPSISQNLEEGDLDKFIRSLEKHVNKMENYSRFDREEKQIEGIIPTNAFKSYFYHFFRLVQKPYLDSFYSINPDLSESAVNFIHEEISKVFNPEPVEFAKKDLNELEKVCDKWIKKTQDLIDNQELDPIKSLKNKGKWTFPILSENAEKIVGNLNEAIGDLRAKAKSEVLKESITQADQCINWSDEIKRVFADYKERLKHLEDVIRSEKNEIDAQHQYWVESIEKIRSLIERARKAVRGFEDQELQRQSMFISNKTIAFKTDKVVSCGLPVFLLNFQNRKSGKMETLVRAPLLLEELSKLQKNPFTEPKGYKEFQKYMDDWFLKKQNEYEIQSAIKNQDMFSLPNLSIQVSNGIDDFLDMGYLNKKTHAKIRDEELHALLKKD